MKESLSARITRLRKDAGLTQGKLAIAIGAANYRTVFNWESSGNKPKAENLRRLADFFGLTIHELKTGTGRAAPPPQPPRFRLISTRGKFGQIDSRKIHSGDLISRPRDQK